MNIVICEDSISDRHKLEKVITKVLIKNNLNSEIILSTNNSASQFQVLCKPSLWCRIEIH